jgi:hypothetical protein
VKSVWVECQEGYSEEDIYSADETGVFYNMTPASTFKFKGEKCIGGILMCVNMTGTDKKDSLLLENHKHHVVSKT